MNWINFWRFSFPRFLTNSLTKSMDAVRGLYKSSMISAARQRNTYTTFPNPGFQTNWSRFWKLTIAFSHVLMWVFLPKLLVIVIEAHKRKYYFKEEDIKSWLQQVVHTILWNTEKEQKIKLKVKKVVALRVLLTTLEQKSNVWSNHII